MALRWPEVVDAFDRLFPEGSPRRKAVHIIAIILLVEGLSVFVLFSYVGFPLGLVSFLIGVFLLLLLQRRDEKKVSGEVTPGIRLIDSFERLLGGGTTMMVIGATLIVIVIIYNLQVSRRPELGDADTITILFGAILLAHPVLSRRYKVESCFALIFVGTVALFLVVPQFVASVSDTSGGTSVGNWYVHYMLAAPFAAILDLIGVPASSIGDMVTIQFKDGSIHTLKISAYCAGLYSFSIFLSAFISFVLVFESLRRRLLAMILILGMIVAYLGNLVRMTVIGVVGYYRGIDALLWAHENVGWMVFLIWSGLFWWIMLNYVTKHASNPRDDNTEVN